MLTSGWAWAQSTAPQITSPLNVDTWFDVPGHQTVFYYRITATNSPTQFAATGLPSSTQVDPVTGSFYLSPWTPAIYNLTVSGTNAAGTGTANVRIAIRDTLLYGSPAQGSGFYGLGAVLRVGVHFETPVVVTGSPWVNAGARFDYESGSGTADLVFKHVVTAADNASIPFSWSVDLNGGTINDLALGLPAFLLVPEPTYEAWMIAFTGQADFRPVVTLTASGTVGAQFSHPSGGLNIVSYSATGLPPGLTIDGASGIITGIPTTAGNYNVGVTGVDASGRTAKMTLSVVIAPSSVSPANVAAHIINLSARAYGNSGADSLVAGFVVGGDSSKSKPLLLRGIGPALGQFGVPGPMAKAALKLYRSDAQVVASDDGWGTDPLLSSTANSVGAFALPANSGDSAIVWALYPGAYTIQVTDDTNTGGNALAEVYDVASGDITVRLINISARARVGGSSATILSGGFVISGSGSETVIIRGIGPALSAFGVASPVSTPTLTLFNGQSTAIAQNAGWPASAPINSTTVLLSDIFAKVGAFALPAGSADCAILVSLPAGNYTAQLGQAGGGGGGIGLLEIYEVSSP